MAAAYPLRLVGCCILVMPVIAMPPTSITKYVTSKRRSAPVGACMACSALGRLHPVGADALIHAAASTAHNTAFDVFAAAAAAGVPVALEGLLFLSWLVLMYMDWVAAARFNSTHVPSVLADVKLLLSFAGVGASGGGGVRSGQYKRMRITV